MKKIITYKGRGGVFYYPERDMIFVLVKAKALTFGDDQLYKVIDGIACQYKLFRVPQGFIDDVVRIGNY